MDWMLYVILGFLCLLVVLLLFVFFFGRKRNSSNELRDGLREMELKQAQLMQEMSTRMNKELLQFQSLLHQSMQSDLHTLREDTTQRLFSMEKNMQDTIHYQLETTGKAFSSMMEEMTRIQEAQHHLQDLSGNIHDLQKILNDKKTRGIFGEIELYSLLENVMGEGGQRYGKQVKLSNGTIVDAALYGGNTMPLIGIDSKFPLENYQRLMEDSLSKEEQRRLSQAFVQDVKKHIQAIATKYIIPHETADFAYLFLPAESLFSYIHAKLPELVQYSFEQHVYLVSPTTLMAYITAIKAIYLNQQRSENMQDIQNELKKLAQEFERFDKRYTSVSNDFERCYQDMQQVSITAQKLIRRFQEIQDVELHTDV